MSINMFLVWLLDPKKSKINIDWCPKAMLFEHVNLLFYLYGLSL